MFRQSENTILSVKKKNEILGEDSKARLWHSVEGAGTYRLSEASTGPHLTFASTSKIRLDRIQTNIQS